MAAHQQHQYKLNFFFEFGGGFCLWPADEATLASLGPGPADEKLELSEALLTRISELDQWYSRSMNTDYPPDPGPWTRGEYEAFHKAANVLLTDIRNFLGPSVEITDQMQSA